MIRNFRRKVLETLFRKGVSKRVSPKLLKRVCKKLDMLEAAISLEDLMALPGNKPHRLQGKRKNEFALHVNGPWRLVFRYKDGYFYEVDLEQYH